MGNGLCLLVFDNLLLYLIWLFLRPLYLLHGDRLRYALSYLLLLGVLRLLRLLLSTRTRASVGLFDGTLRVTAI